MRKVVGLLVLALVAASCVASGPDATSPTPDVGDRVVGDILLGVRAAAGDRQLDETCREDFADVEVEGDLAVGLVADVSTIQDGTFTQAAFEGMVAAERCFGIETGFLESAGTGDAAQRLDDMLATGVDVALTVGYPFQEATVAAARARPHIRFVGIDQVNDVGLPNYVAVSFRDDQVGHLAGAAAALLSRTGTVAVVAGPETVPPVVAMAEGFEAGARAVDPGVVVLRSHVPSFMDPVAGAAQAEALLARGADVVFGAAGRTGTGALHRAAGMGARVVGVDLDEYLTTFAGGAHPGADRLATSALKRVDLGVFLTLAAMVSGPVRGGGLVLDASSGGVGYAPLRGDDLPADLEQRLEEVRTSLVAAAADR